MQRIINELRRDFLKPANQVHDQSLLLRGFPEEEPEETIQTWLTDQFKIVEDLLMSIPMKA